MALSFTSLARPAAAEELAQFSKDLGFPIPKAYGDFLKTYNGAIWDGEGDMCFVYREDGDDWQFIDYFYHIATSVDDRQTEHFRKERFSYYSVMKQTEVIKNNFQCPPHIIKIASSIAHAHVVLDLISGEISRLDDEVDVEWSEATFIEALSPVAKDFQFFIDHLEIIVDHDAFWESW